MHTLRRILLIALVAVFGPDASRAAEPAAPAPAPARTGYLLVMGTVTNMEVIGRYARTLPPIYAKFGGTYLASGGVGRNVTVLEGTFAHQSLILARFPSLERPNEFWWGPDYRASRAIREGAGKFDVVKLKGAPADAASPQGRPAYLLSIAAIRKPEALAPYAAGALPLLRAAGARVIVSNDRKDIELLEGEFGNLKVTVVEFPSLAALNAFYRDPAYQALIPLRHEAGDYTVLAIDGTPQSPAADASRPGATLQDCPACPKLVVVPAGRFRMGSPPDEPLRDADEGPVREVAFARPFAVGAYEVTRGQFAAFVAATGHRPADKCLTMIGGERVFAEGKSWRDPGFPQRDDHPVVCVSWRDAAAYADWLRATTGQPYRLVSEAELEYVTRAGTAGAYAMPGGEANACAYGNVADARATAAVPAWRALPCDDGVGLGTAPVGSNRPNGFGLYDTIGNAWEWVADCYHADFASAPVDGSAWGRAGECGAALDRGGGFSDLLPGNLRSANRSRAPSPDVTVYSLGFRVARDLR